MTSDFTAKYIWAYALALLYGLFGEIFIFKIIEINLTNPRQRKIATTV